MQSVTLTLGNGFFMTVICQSDPSMVVSFSQEGPNVTGKITITTLSIYKVLRKFIPYKFLFYLNMFD